MANDGRRQGGLIMGGLDCAKSDVFAAILGSTSFGELHNEWRTVALHLGLPDYRIRELSQNYLWKVHVKTLPQLVDELLSIWKAEKGDQAKIADLCKALHKCGLVDISQSLSSKFNLHSLQNEQRFIWQGKLVSLNELLGEDKDSDKEDNDTPEPKRTPIIKPHLTPPPQPKYYVPRTLFYIPSNEIDQKIFLSESTRDHVFLFKDIPKAELAKLTRYKFPIEVSGNQLHGVSVRFIVLECDEDYDRICKKTSKIVHMVQWKQERYFWIKSTAALDVIRQFLTEPAKDISEEELVNRILSIPSPCSISIADSPGMGKTMVRANLAAEIQERCSSSNTMHLFIVLQEFVRKSNSIIKSSTSVLEAVAAYCSTDEDTKRVLFKMLKKFYQVYLFLDGYDEVLQDKVGAVEAFLKCAKELQNFKVVVTTRPHLKTQLEQIFNQFSYEIHPFNEEDQTDFLTRYWVEIHGAENCEVLQNFALQCLSALQSSMSDEEKEIAGIPLQCMMLGEVYIEDAKRAIQLRSLHPDSVKPITFIQMYRRLVDLKLSRIPDENSKQNYRNAHVHQATKLLFPEWAEIFKPVLGGHDDVDDYIMYSIGLVERSPSTTPRFVHRTFAEFLLAEFIVTNLEKHQECVDILFGEIIGRRGTIRHLDTESPKLHTLRLEICELKHPVMGSFIDLHLKEYSANEFQFPDYSIFTNVGVEDVYTAFRACCSNDLESTFNYVSQFVLHKNFDFDEGLRDQYFQNMPHLIARRCKNTKTLQEFKEVANELLGVDWNWSYHVVFQYMLGIPFYTPVHEAFNQGKYNFVVWLVEEYGEQVCQLKNLMHACVRESKCDSELVVANKLLIISMLLSINGSWVKEKDVIGCTPLLQENIHLSVLQHLVQNGADINAYACRRGTILHQAERFNRDEYLELVRWAFSNGFKLINHMDRKGTTTLMQAIVSCGTVDDEVLGSFVEAGADLNAEDMNGDSVLFYAIKYSGMAEFVEKLIKLGADAKHKSEKDENALHTLIRGNGLIEERLATLDMLIGIDPYWINKGDIDGCTPFLEYCKKSENLNFDLRLLQRLVEHGADINACSSKSGTVLHSIIDDMGTYADLACWAFSNGFNLVNQKDENSRTPLMKAIEHFKTLDLNLLQLFVEAGAELNVEDESGDSVLFYALKFSGNMEFVKKLIELGAEVQHLNKKGQNAVHKILYAADGFAEDKLTTLNSLVEINRDWIHESDHDGCTPLLINCDFHSCLSLLDLKLLERLVELGADINAYSSKYGTVLHNVPDDIDDYYLNFLRWAFTNGFNLVNRTNQSNQSPLIHAIVKYGEYLETITEVLQLLLKAGADVNAEDKSGNSVLFNALEYSDNTGFIKTLIEQGAEVQHKNKTGQNAVHKLMECIG